jgi:uncharacterized protein YrrD
MVAEAVPTVRSEVFVSGHKKVGTIAALVVDPATGALAAIDVEYGLLRHHHKRVSADLIKWTNPKNVVLAISVDEFKSLADEPASGAGAPQASPSHTG